MITHLFYTALEYVCLTEYNKRRFAKRCTAGSGKSVLVSRLIDETVSIADRMSTSLIFSYFDYVDKRTLVLANIFCSMVQQLLLGMDICPEPILELVDRILLYPEVPDLDDVIELLDAIMVNLPSIVVFVDGMDELPEKDQRTMLKALWALENRHSPCKFRFCISSRESAAYMMTPPAKFEKHSLNLSQHSITQDIDTYVTHLVEAAIGERDLIPVNESLKNSIIQRLIIGSKGM